MLAQFNIIYVDVQSDQCFYLIFVQQTLFVCVCATNSK